MRPNFPFRLAASYANLKPGDLLKWKMRLAKDVRLLLPLIEEVKTVELTSLPPDTARLSSPNLRRRCGKRLALLFPKSDSKSLYSLLRSVADSSSCNSPNCSPRKLAAVFPNYLRSHISVSQPKVFRSRARGYMSELRRATCPEASNPSFCFLFSFPEFLAAATNLCSSIDTDLDTVAYPMLKHLPLAWIFVIFSISGLCNPFIPSLRHLLYFHP